MKSKIAEAIKLSNHPVAVYRSSEAPEGAVQFKEDAWGCVVSLINAAAVKGKTAACCRSNTACLGGKAGLGLKPYEPGFIEYFLSTGREGENGKAGGRPAEHYKKSPELVIDYINSVPKMQTPEYMVFAPLVSLDENAEPEEIIFLVNPDQLSGLAVLANYDMRTNDNVRLFFGAGCLQSVLHGIVENEKNGSHCFIGLTDPSARKYISKELLSFTIPYRRFIEMEANVEGSFLQTEEWKHIFDRI